MFSGSTPGSSRGESPTYEGVGGGSGSDYEPRLVGMGPGGRMLRRKQGKEAWGGEEKMEGHEDDEDWDVERAVEQRLVQIMFTVPKERLRVVNAEIEREEEAELVDPEKEWDDDDEDYDESKRYGRDTFGGDLTDVERMGLRRVESPLHELIPSFDHDAEKLALRREESRNTEGNYGVREQMLEVPEQEGRPSTPLTPTTFHTAEVVRLERPSKTTLLDVKESLESLARPRTPKTVLDVERPRTPKQVLDVKESIESLERPKTKVLQMVESIEGLSRMGSPANTPGRERGISESPVREKESPTREKRVSE